MTDKSTQEILCAFAAGCMDKNNFVHFKEYMKEDKDLPYEDLGVLQNIMTMIPIILEVETPKPELKNRVAKSLIEITDEIKAKKKFDGKKTIIEKKPPEKTEPILKESPKRITRITVSDHKRAEDDLLIKSGKEEKYPIDEVKITNFPSMVKEKPKPEPRKQKSPVFIYILVALLIVLVGVIAYSLNKANNNLESQLAELRTELSSVKNDLISSQRFVSNYMSLIEFFHYNDITVVNLERTDSSKATGKLFLSFEERETLLQVANMPSLSPDQVFELWFVSKGVSISMGVFAPKVNQTYIKIPSFPSAPKEDIELFRITIESAEGSDIPSGNLILFGALSNPKPPEPVRRRRW